MDPKAEADTGAKAEADTGAKAEADTGAGDPGIHGKLSAEETKKLTAAVKHYVPANAASVDDPGESSAEEMLEAESINILQSPPTSGRMPFAVDAALMTLPARRKGKRIPIKGNQLLLWSREVLSAAVSYAITSDDYEKHNQRALAERTIKITSPRSWLLCEGLFTVFRGLARDCDQPFRGSVVIQLTRPANGGLTTTVEFRNKWKAVKNSVSKKWKRIDTNILYAHLNDPIVIKHLTNTFGLPKYRYADNCGLSYPDIVDIVGRFAQANNLTDAEIADKQLCVFQHKCNTADPLSRFLAFFNAVLFGSESSRNSLSFMTGIITLVHIQGGRLTYSNAFKTPPYEEQADLESMSLAKYPMASPFAGSGNFKGLLELLGATAIEQSKGGLSSQLGMTIKRKYPLWGQIANKEAILIKDWLCSSAKLFRQRGASKDPILICSAVQRALSGLFSNYFGVPYLAALPAKEYEESRQITTRWMDKNMSPERISELSEQAKQNRLGAYSMVYPTSAEDAVIFSNYFKGEKLFYKYQYDEYE